MQITYDGWTIADWFGDDEPRIRDLDLAVRLGLGQPRAVRELIERLRAEGAFEYLETPEILRSGGQYHLTEQQALVVAARAGTAEAQRLMAVVAEVVVEHDAAQCEITTVWDFARSEQRMSYE